MNTGRIRRMLDSRGFVGDAAHLAAFLREACALIELQANEINRLRWDLHDERTGAKHVATEAIRRTKEAAIAALWSAYRAGELGVLTETEMQAVVSTVENAK